MKPNNKSNSVIISAILALVVLVSFASSAQAKPGYAELRCRGGENLFRLDDLGESGGTNNLLLGLSFMPSSQSAGANSSGIEPGTCTWIDRTLAETEPQQIQVQISLAEATTLAAYLQDPNNYWTFIVRDTKRGYYETSSHKPWKAQPLSTACGKPLD